MSNVSASSLDRDECKRKSAVCADNSCHNNEVDYTCDCPNGYYGDGKYFCGGKTVVINLNRRLSIVEIFNCKNV